MYEPGSPTAKDRVRKTFDEQLAVQVEEGIDFVIGETFSWLGEALLAVECGKKTGLPTMVTVCFENKPVTTDGKTAAECAKALVDAGADIVGINCLRSPEHTLPLMEEMRKAVSGLPRLPARGLPHARRTRPTSRACPQFPFELDPLQLTPQGDGRLRAAGQGHRRQLHRRRAAAPWPPTSARWPGRSASGPRRPGPGGSTTASPCRPTSTTSTRARSRTRRAVVAAQAPEGEGPCCDIRLFLAVYQDVGQAGIAAHLTQNADLNGNGNQEMEKHMNEQPSPERILQTGLAFWASKTLLSAIEMGLFTELARGPEHFEALSGRLGLHPRSARDFLDTLVALGFLQRERRSLRQHARDGPVPRSEEAVVRRAASSRWRTIACIRSGATSPRRFAPAQPQNEVKSGGPGLFETLYADPARLKHSSAAMTGISHGANMTIARAFPWKDYRTFVDVGTAQGDLAAQIALANPHLRGIGFDLPEVAPIFEEYVAAVGVADRLTFVPGDFFKQDLPEGRRRADGAHPARLGSAHEEDADQEGLRRGPGRRRAHRLRGHHRRRPVEERLRVDDEPQHAHRDAGRLRLHRRRLRGMDEGGRFSATRVEPLVGPDSMVIGIK